MKRQVFFLTGIFLLLAVSALGAEEPTGIFALNETTFILVQPIDGGSTIEMLELRNGKLVIVDSIRYIRKNAIGGGYEIEFERAEKIREK